MSLKAMEGDAIVAHGHDHATQRLSMQYENIDQQNETYIVGMWTFLVTEIMFFGALFLVYSLYRVLYFDVYLDASRFLDLKWGAINTMILLFSSYTMVLGVDAAQKGQRTKVMGFLSVTLLCAFAFLGIKAIEYTAKFEERLFPDARFDYNFAVRTFAHHEGKSEPLAHDGKSQHMTTVTGPALVAEKAPVEGFNSNTATAKPGEFYLASATPQALKAKRANNHARIFFSIYFVMTGLHAVHVIVGILLIGYLVHLYERKRACVDDYMPTEMIGMYWHFVDIVWIFLFPMMYLIA
jgi:cytochrome c oxidase subunit 3